MPADSNIAEIEAHVPLATLFDSADKLRSLSQGCGASSMEQLEYKIAP